MYICTQFLHSMLNKSIHPLTGVDIAARATETSLKVTYFLVVPALLVPSETAPHRSELDLSLLRSCNPNRVIDLVAVDLQLLIVNYHYHLIASAHGAKSSHVSSL